MEKKNCSREEKLRVIVVEPMKKLKVMEIDNNLEAMQRIVGGYIETYPIADKILIICNEEGKVNRLPLNRAIYKGGNLIEIIAGTFFICQEKEGNPEFYSLSEEQIKIYMEQFEYPEIFNVSYSGIEISKVI